jgi:hypothetical protein
MKILFLDDERNPSDVTWINYGKDVEFYVVRTYQQFLDYLQFENSNPDGVSFDHDLGTKEDGMTCAKSLIHHITQNHLRLPQIFIHSKNPIGAENIKSYFDSWWNFHKTYET